MKIFRRIALTAAVVALSASSASAQSADADNAGVARTNLVSANPIGLLFEWYNGEYEHAASGTASLAVAGSSFDFLDDTRYTSVDGIARYYPGAHALRGFSVGASAGIVYMRDRYIYTCIDTCVYTTSKNSSATLGVRADYVWILGRDQRFVAAAGIGAKRVLSDNLDTEGIPIGRLSIGYAF